MNGRLLGLGLGLGFVLASSAPAEVYRGVDFPGGAASFADAVVDYSPVYAGGGPTAPHTVAENALGIPDYDGVNSCGATCTFVTLGDGGTITLQFQDNVLTGSGTPAKDLWIFEVGPDVEDTFVEISVDGDVWQAVGKVYGSTAGVDLDAFGFGPESSFRYVRLRDDPDADGQSGITVGADIDAVGAISTLLSCTILSVAPPLPWSPGDLVTITGAGFLEGAVPLIGGVEAAPFTQVSDTEIQATVPALADGDYALEVSIAGAVTCRYDGPVTPASDVSWGALKGVYR